MVWAHHPGRAETSAHADERTSPSRGWHRCSMDYETGRFTTAEPTEVRTREDFATFAEALLRDFRDKGSSEWENTTLENFLDALAAFSDARLVDRDPSEQEVSSWRLFAEILAAATGYE